MTVTHHMSEVVEADRVVVIEGGKIVLEGTPREVFRNQELLHQLQLDVPQASQMARLLHDQHPDFAEDLIHRDELIAEVVRSTRQKEANAG